MDNVVLFRKAPTPQIKLSPKKWQLVIQACQELWYASDMKIRKVTQSETHRKILAILSKHFSAKDAPIILEMIMASYTILFMTNFWEMQLGKKTGATSPPDLSWMHKKISHLLAVAHYEGSTKNVYKECLELSRKVTEYEMLTL
jgi:hypothetical protein